MTKQKPRIVIGWRHRQNDVRDTRSRMRSATAFKADTLRAAEALKKKA